MVSAIERAIDQRRQPGMKRTCVRSPDRFHHEHRLPPATGFSKEITRPRPQQGPGRETSGVATGPIAVLEALGVAPPTYERLRTCSTTLLARD